MADATNAPVQPPESGAPAPGAKSSSGFLATTTGKIVVGVVALLVLLAIAGAIVVMLASGGVARLLNSGSVTVAVTNRRPHRSRRPRRGRDGSRSWNPLRSRSPRVSPSETCSRPRSRRRSAPSAETSSSDDPARPIRRTPSTSSTSSPPTGSCEGVFVWNGVTYTEGDGRDDRFVAVEGARSELGLGSDAVRRHPGDPHRRPGQSPSSRGPLRT